MNTKGINGRRNEATLAAMMYSDIFPLSTPTDMFIAGAEWERKKIIDACAEWLDDRVGDYLPAEMKGRWETDGVNDFYVEDETADKLINELTNDLRREITEQSKCQYNL